MAEGLSNNGSNVVRADIYYNDNGTIKDITNMEVWVNNDDTMYKFPQKDNCVVNFDSLTWCSSSLDSASSFIKRNISYSSQGSNRTSLGNVVNIDPSGSLYQVKNNSYWYIPNSYRNYLQMDTNILANRTFTIALTCKFRGQPQDWRNLTWFNNSDGLRFEYTGNPHTLAVYSENRLISETFPQLPSYTTDYFNLIMVVNGLNIKVFQNGTLVLNTNFSRELNTSNGDKLYYFVQRGASSSTTGTFGCAVELKHLQVWDVALTDQEVRDLRKFLFLS